MSQVKIYANEQTIMQYREMLSHAIHQALIEELKYPIEKRFQRFISLKPKTLSILQIEASTTLLLNFQCLLAEAPKPRKD